MKGNIVDLGMFDIPMEYIKRNVNQPRTIFNDVSLRELADNIRQNGLLQAVVLRKLGNNDYILVCGERRWRACQLLQSTTIKANVIECNDQTMQELATVENLVREDLSLLEEARGYIYLKNTFGYDLAELSKIASKSPSNICNIMSVMNECPEVQAFVDDGTLTLAALVWIKQLPNDKEKIQILEKLRNETLRRNQVRTYVERIVSAYKIAEQLGIDVEELLKQERVGKGGRFDIHSSIPSEFNFYFIMDYVMSSDDINYLPFERKNILFSAFTYNKDKSAAKRLARILLERDKIDRLFCDSGVVPAARAKCWEYFDQVDSLLGFYDSIKPDVCVNLDVPTFKFVMDNWQIPLEEMMNKTMHNAEKFSKWKPSFPTTKIYPLQGVTPKDYVDSLYAYNDIGVFDTEDSTGIGLGGIARSGGDYQVEVAKVVTSDPIYQKLQSKFVIRHMFGVGNPSRIVNLYKYGFNSADALTTVVTTTTGGYWLRDGTVKRHIVHESPLVRKVRMHFNMVSFAGQLTEKFAQYRNIPLADEIVSVDLSDIEDYVR